MAEDLPDLVPRPDPTILTTAALKLSIDSLKELLQEKIDGTFDRVWGRIDSMEKQRLETKADNQKAIDAALESQKQLFNQQQRCNETSATTLNQSLTKQIDALGREARSSKENFDARIQDLKEQLDKKAGKDERTTEKKSDNQWMIATALSVVGIVIGIIIGIVIPLAVHH